MPSKTSFIVSLSFTDQNTALYTEDRRTGVQRRNLRQRAMSYGRSLPLTNAPLRDNLPA